MSPEERLLADQILQAKADFVMAPAESALHDEARRWLFSSSSRKTSFLWICGLIGLEPREVRQQAELERAAVLAVRRRHHFTVEVIEK